MKTTWIAALLLALSITTFAQTPKFKELSRAEFEALLSKPEQLLIVDVRRPDEVMSVGGFPVYLNIQIGDLEKSLPWIPKDRTIVTVSNHATRSGRAAEFLSSKGFKLAGTVGAQTYSANSVSPGCSGIAS